ncbi:MAG: FG-GAP-like repeat-containing protein [Minicystis sp.]
MKRAFAFGFVSLATLAAAAASCGGSGTSTTGTGGHGHGGGATGGSSTTTTNHGGHGGEGAGFMFDSGPNCNDGDACGDGGVCLNGACCTSGIACGTACCNAGDVCNFQKCETPGSVCVDSTDCPMGSFCDYSLGAATDADAGPTDGGACMGGAAQQTGKCLSSPPECAPNQDPGNPITCLPKCEYQPPTSDFTPVQKYYWGGHITSPFDTDVMMTPIVINLDDDNCDGKVNQNDIPEIVFSTFRGGGYYKQGTLHAISIVGGQVVDKWAKADVVQPGGGLAAADLDGDGVPEIVGCMNPGPSGVSCCDAVAQNTGAIAFRADGSTFWTQIDTTQVHCGYEAPVIADFDQDGSPEVLIGWTILDGKTGAVKKVLDPSNTVNSWGIKLTGVADLDGDGKLDVTDGQRAYRADGTVIWDLSTGPNAVKAGYHAVGDFDKDGKPEVVIISSGGPHTMQLVQYDPQSPDGAKVIRKGVDINNGKTTVSVCGGSSERGGGPPTVADFDGDGFPDVGAAGAIGYVVFSGAKMMDPAVPDNQLILWIKDTHDCSSAVTGSSVFDFNGDGKAEVIYSDEYHLWMYDGATGQNLINPSICNTTGTLWEYPLVADVDNDGQADIIVASNAYGVTCPEGNSKQSGIRVFGSASGSWVRTRRIWNEHTYHITNVGEDGKVPAVEPPNWTQPGLDNYRLNRQPGSVFSAPDAVVSIAPQCGATYGLVATVRNLGTGPLPPGVNVGFYMGTAPNGTLLGSGATTKALYPAEGENVVLPLPNAPSVVTSGTTPVYAVVDDGKPNHPWHECRPDNNTSAATSGKCDSPK